jgi:hypothetical protein
MHLKVSKELSSVQPAIYITSLEGLICKTELLSEKKNEQVHI